MPAQSVPGWLGAYFVETCRANKISFRVWLEDVLRRFSSTPAKEIDSLLPQNWKPVASPLD
jgi:hypothetical protein